ncbi:MAG: septal ring lytic transglycosylase RlpA family protein [Proteobacteria bacterium]|nr:septal ring lytic transglycosylase RlpA family protein [Pseudomonadota bacterium]MCL2307534.1 septal ring lytic transglycosylase RlpA family protein [Pseudomonadota bacterium]
MAKSTGVGFSQRERNAGQNALRVLLLCLITPFLLAACSSPPKTTTGGYYQDDGPSSTTINLDAIPDAVPRAEPLHRFANRPYTVLGRTYVPATTLAPYKARGTASWYGKKFHGNKTSTGETYDMFAMSAAHPTLPLPSYARVTGVASGKSVVVRVNDRGPFLHDRLIDLSYAAAHRIGIAAAGTGEVIVETILPGAPRSAEGGGGVFPTTPAAPESPAAPVATPAQPADTALQTVSSGVIVQLGVFADAANAATFLAHVQGLLDATQYSARIQQRDDGKYRVFLGPYPQRADAQQAAAHLNEALGLTTFVTAP